MFAKIVVLTLHSVSSSYDIKILGAEWVNRKYDRLGALCCGYSHGFMVNVSKEELVEKRMKNIMDTKDAGAEAMMFLCPCVLCILETEQKPKV